MSNRFYFGGSDSGSDADDNDASLPFPKPLERTAFLAPDFDAATFLSSLSNRFQTLEDLQAELRELSQTLNKELVDLVNDNYQDFLSLGSTLYGGEEKIEDIRLGLLGFERDVKAVRDKVDTRRNEVAELLRQKKALRQETSVGQALLEIAERLDLLEEKLEISTSTKIKSQPQDGGGEQWGDEWIEEATANDVDEEFNSDGVDGVPPRLQRRTEEFLILKYLASKHSPQHPFLLAQEGRIRKIQEILLSDLEMAIKQETEVKYKQQLMQIRGAIEE
ncbi:uncharacterized protein Z520_03434 [Fonsecaea multimorphosa CBS 102226]|uniref:Conserved oligomeric Golgi complex subunit 2 n=1 Tax=Fonsecaea multimorphosa CBS 102226 TaxID=1442371 RepID=A0A0D2KVI3_9EURO|nr:uncharacterized protein Z520_03434 [Fonsecaea multimorphosa CBS 102226]KIY00769.1 hypothetical protein Z520_03434 [Fonsecaea multimorphosa CBS 102226]OAL27867.1 hypothetical protein AYO22_03212 [Fonsecaea multimorphosa]